MNLQTVTSEEAKLADKVPRRGVDNPTVVNSRVSNSQTCNYICVLKFDSRRVLLESSYVFYDFVLKYYTSKYQSIYTVGHGRNAIALY